MGSETIDFYVNNVLSKYVSMCFKNTNIKQYHTQKFQLTSDGFGPNKNCCILPKHPRSERCDKDNKH